MVIVTLINPDGTETVIAEQGREGYEILSCTTTIGLDTVSSGEISIPATNKMRNVLRGRNPTVAIYEDSKRVFIGSVASPVVEDVFGNVNATLDGALSWLADICKPPFRVESSANMTIADYLGRLVTQYNNGARADRQIKLGGVTVSGTVAVVHSDEYVTMLDLIKEIRETFGGYLLEVCGGKGDFPRVDYIAQPTMKNPRPLTFGENLKSLDKTLTFDGYASRVCATTRDGLSYTAIDSSAEQIWGRVDYPMTSDAATAEDLQAAAEAELALRSTPLRQIEAEAVGDDAIYLPSQLVDVVDAETGLTVEMNVLSVETNHLSGVRRVRAGKNIVSDFTAASTAGERKAEKTATAIRENEDWRWVQDRIRHEGVSTIPLRANTAYCVIPKDSDGYLWEYSINRPKAVFSWARKTINIVAAVKTTTTINAATDDDIPILIGLPTIFTPISVHAAIIVHPPSGQSFVLNGRYSTYKFSRVWGERRTSATDTRTFLDDLDPNVYTTAFVRETAEHWTYESNAWVRRYTPSGSLEINYIDSTRSSAFNIPSGSILEISQQPISMVLTSGGNTFPRIRDRDITRVSDWIKSHRGLYDYSNNGIRRRELVDPVSSGTQTYGATDCSGMIHMAFRCGAGKWVPDGTKTMIGFGKVVTFAKAGEELDTSLLQEGDIVGFIEPSASPRLGNMHHVGIVVKGLPNNSTDTKLRIWHQTTTFCCYNGEAEAWMQKDDDVITSYQQYIHKSIVTPQRKKKDANGDPVVDGQGNPVYEDNLVVFGPQPACKAASRTTGVVYSDANFSLSNARIVVRWKEDSDNLRRATVTVEDDLGGESGIDDDH